VPDLCGDKILDFKLNGTATSLLSGNNQDFINFSPPADTSDFGIGQATVQASLKNYPSILSPRISFSATILGSVTPKIND